MNAHVFYSILFEKIKISFILLILFNFIHPIYFILPFYYRYPLSPHPHVLPKLRHVCFGPPKQAPMAAERRKGLTAAVSHCEAHNKLRKSIGVRMCEWEPVGTEERIAR